MFQTSWMINTRWPRSRTQTSIECRGSAGLVGSSNVAMRRVARASSRSRSCIARCPASIGSRGSPIGRLKEIASGRPNATPRAPQSSSGTPRPRPSSIRLIHVCWTLTRPPSSAWVAQGRVDRSGPLARDGRQGHSSVAPLRGPPRWVAGGAEWSRSFLTVLSWALHLPLRGCLAGDRSGVASSSTIRRRFHPLGPWVLVRYDCQEYRCAEAGSAPAVVSQGPDPRRRPDALRGRRGPDAIRGGSGDEARQHAAGHRARAWFGGPTGSVRVAR